MKKLLLIPILFFTVLLNGQLMAPGVTASSATSSTGSNMISNGTFDDGTGWQLANGVTISNDSARYDGATDFGLLYQSDAVLNGSMQADTDYRLSFDIVATGAYFRVQSSDGGVLYVAYDTYTTGAHSVEFNVSDIGLGGIRIYTRSSGSGYVLDNLTLVTY